MEQGVKNERADWHCGQPIDVGPAPADHPWVADYTRWLTGPEARLLDSEKLFDGLCGRLTEAGVPIDSCVLLFKTLHPIYPGHNYFWTRERGTWLVPLSHDFDNSARMLVSPYQEARSTVVRRSASMFRTAPKRGCQFSTSSPTKATTSWSVSSYHSLSAKRRG
jgi:hypothetical protein